jgi:hypothetical protein
LILNDLFFVGVFFFFLTMLKMNQFYHPRFSPTNKRYIGPKTLAYTCLTETHLKKPGHISYLGMISWDSSELRRYLTYIMKLKKHIFYIYDGVAILFLITHLPINYRRILYISWWYVWLWVFLGDFLEEETILSMIGSS